MTSHFQALIAAIVDDDSAGSRNLLTSNPAMAASRFDADVLYDSKIAHWIYVGDTALHVAAAGYRVEIARLLLAASANVRSAKIAAAASRFTTQRMAHWRAPHGTPKDRSR